MPAWGLGEKELKSSEMFGSPNMCQSCNGTGSIHITDLAVTKVHHCYDCPPAERKARRQRFDSLYQKVKKTIESEAVSGVPQKNGGT